MILPDSGAEGFMQALTSTTLPARECATGWDATTDLLKPRNRRPKKRK
jgi:hypothetical protein